MFVDYKIDIPAWKINIYELAKKGYRNKQIDDILNEPDAIENMLEYEEFLIAYKKQCSILEEQIQKQNN